MKKRILFILHQLDCGGVEKALVNMLKLIDRDVYDCEILVLKKGGSFEKLIPSDVKIRSYNMPEYVEELTRYRSPSLCKDDNLKIRINKVLWTIFYTANRGIIKFTKRSLLYWVIYNKYKKINLNDKYDAIIDAMGYGCYPTYLASNMAKANVRVSWIHEQTIYRQYGLIRKSYKNFDKIFGCSLDCCRNFVNSFPEYENKVSVYYNFLDVDEIKNKAKEEINISCFSGDAFKIVSVGRVGAQKQFSRVITVSNELMRKGYKFVWMVIGEGEQLEELRQKVVELNLEEYVIFQGFDMNPFKYLNKADLYVQTSIAEGFCTTISEAIVLGKPVVTTDVSGAREQLDEDKGGIIVGQSCEALVTAIETLINDRELLEKYAQYCEEKCMDYKAEINKLYEVI